MLDPAFILGAITIGFMGSFHCIGMCGPIAMSLPVIHLEGWKRYLGILLYNTGRVLTYSFIGGMLGWIGSRFVLFGWQQLLSLIIGILMIGYCCMLVFRINKLKFFNLSAYWHKLVAPFFIKVMNSKNMATPLLLGLLNGLLPCGLVYIAVAGSVTAGSVQYGALFMFLFGIGTIPAMFAVSIIGHFASVKFRNGIKKISPVIVGCMGLLLVLRGMNLNIPYLSPQVQNEQVQCCH
jgi:sulfite exporter TauE/SafE